MDDSITRGDSRGQVLTFSYVKLKKKVRNSLACAIVASLNLFLMKSGGRRNQGKNKWTCFQNSQGSVSIYQKWSLQLNHTILFSTYQVMNRSTSCAYSLFILRNLLLSATNFFKTLGSRPGGVEKMRSKERRKKKKQKKSKESKGVKKVLKNME